MATIKLLSMVTTNNMVSALADKHVGFAAKLLSHRLSTFVDELYADGYLLVDTSDAKDRLAPAFEQKRNATVGCVQVFEPEYGYQFLLARATVKQLPVALIKKQLDAIYCDLLESHIFFGLVDEGSRAKVSEALDRPCASVLLTLKEVIRNAVGQTETRGSTGSSDAGGGTSDHGSVAGSAQGGGA